MASAGFLSEFPPVTTEEWESAIRSNVTGPDYAAKLIWHPEEGLGVRPYYRAEDIADFSFLNAAPGEFPYVRGARAAGGWRIREEIDAADPASASRSAMEAIAAGAEEISFCGVCNASQADVALMLGNLDGVPIRLSGLSQQSALKAAELFRGRPHSSQVSGDVDPLAEIAFSTELLSNSGPDWRVFTVCAEKYGEQGLSAIEQIAFALSAAVEYLDAMLDRGVSIGRACDAVGFSFATGPQFFVEIAKLRAFRLVWAKVVESFGGNHQNAKAAIYGRTTHWNETIYDPHNNVLRATTAAMSAVLGGVESFSVAPFDVCYRQPDEASRRLARNVQVVLKREAGFARVADALGGAYLIEVLTNTIASKAWKLFQELEAAGGHRKAQDDGVIASVLERRVEDRDRQAAYRRLVLTGTNQFANPREKASDGDGSFQPIGRERVASSFEEIRLRTERAAASGRMPKVLLAEFGDAKMRGARAQFAADFLACAGLSGNVREVGNPLEVAEADADLIVLCSSDAEYAQFAGALMPALKRNGSRVAVVVAGNPADADVLKAVGIADFIHLRSNAVETLTRLQRLLGIGD
jgi:methylmalonyl-CoA mutase